MLTYIKEVLNFVQMFLLLLGLLTFCSSKRDISKESPLVYPEDMNKKPPIESSPNAQKN